MPQKSQTTTLNKHLGRGEIVHSIAQSFEIAAEAIPEGQMAYKGKVEKTLKEVFAGYVRGRGSADPRVYAFTRMAGVTHGDRNRWEPGEAQRQLRTRLGEKGEAPEPSETFTELVAMGVDDLINHFEDEKAKLRAERDQADELRAIGEQVPELRGELSEARQQIADLESELSQTRDKLNHYLGREALGLDAVPAQKTEKPRRISLWKETGLDEHKGVYYTEREGERVYEIGFTEDGKQKWPTIGPDLDEAIAARAAVTEAVAA